MNTMNANHKYCLLNQVTLCIFLWPLMFFCILLIIKPPDVVNYRLTTVFKLEGKCAVEVMTANKPL